MCCGTCNIWQHIPCHEEKDRRDGRRPRDWEKEEFCCSRCRSGPSQEGRDVSRTVPFHAPQHTRMKLQWDHGKPNTMSPGQSQPPQMGPVERRDYYQMPPASAITNGEHSYPRPAYNVHPSSLPASTDQYSNISFSHYQPHQRGFTSRHQPPVYSSAHHPNTHHSHSQPTRNVNPIYPAYTNGAGNPILQGYPGQPGFGGHNRTPVSALPLQVSKKPWPLHSET